MRYNILLFLLIVFLLIYVKDMGLSNTIKVNISIGDITGTFEV
jgi:hypothetical protein